MKVVEIVTTHAREPEDIVPFEKTIEDTGVSYRKIVEILSKTHKTFIKLTEAYKVVDVTTSRIGLTTGFLSQIYNVMFHFSNGQAVSVIAKIPLVGGIDAICGADGEVNPPPADEKPNAHSIECEFYDQFSYMRDVPLPKVYYTEKITPSDKGLILMENLSLRSDTPGFYKGATEEQCYSLARAVAHYQFCAAAPRHQPWWRQFHDNIHTEFDMNLVKPLWGFAHTIEEFKDVLHLAEPYQNKEFWTYALRERAAEYNAISMCHGDTQPNNLMFKLKKDGTMSDELLAIIDWQLVFYASAPFDLARFICMGVDWSVREQCETKVFDVYYNTLSDLYAKSCQKPPFTYAQGLELYHLTLMHQGVQAVMYVSMIALKLQQSNHVEPLFPILVNRVRDVVLRTAELGKMYNLERFAQFSSWTKDL
ncbi:unnamed protein product [Bursaphelenchus okinawaensis]|uniref:CHK kinase-like domain-containing protein n=1 Tax=Bursaphelenchus okinawaensis TaxID=465554 RepID=A0A811K5F8_9BILA|nr:unnamed protein product [Bursaphelenchus okinawaensis]CAG9091759.1 unnamed protein product [Bursaphelenchus okinawaensis]